MGFDFDRVIERRGTGSIKYGMKVFGKPDDLLPLWVADMDFMSPPCVTDALSEYVKHGIYGYAFPDGRYFDALHAWMSSHFGWEIKNSWLVRTSGVVSSIHIALLALTEPGDGVIIQEPVYYPFAGAIKATGRRTVVSRLINDGGVYKIDFDDFERRIESENVKAFIMCNPHNPVGRVWTRAELMRIGEICLRHGVVVISDEIHQDFVYDGQWHTVFAGLDERHADITVTCTAPTKTFNLAGMPVANIIIPNEGLRERFARQYDQFGVKQLGMMGSIACLTAYEGGGEWLSELVTYLAGNMALIRDFLSDRLPEIKFTPPEGTYLAWLDFAALGLDEKELETLISDKARLWLDAGVEFGAGGEGFMRINAACPRSVLLEALERLERAVRG